MYHNKREAQFDRLFELNSAWREKIEQSRSNNEAWLSFLMEHDVKFLSTFDPSMIADIYPSQIDMALLLRSFPVLPHDPYLEIEKDTTVVDELRLAMFDLFMVKKTYAEWMKTYITPISTFIFEGSDLEAEAALEFYFSLMKISNCMIGMVYYAIQNDFAAHETAHDTCVVLEEANVAVIDLECALTDLVFASRQIGINVENSIFDILHKSSLELAQDLEP